MVEILDQTFSDAAKFLDALRLSKGEWWTYDTETKELVQDGQRDWIFRGESSTGNEAGWEPLLPSSWRKKNADVNAPLSIVRERLSKHSAFHDKIAPYIATLPVVSLVRPPLSDDEKRERKERTETAVLNAFAEITLVNEFIRLADE